MKDIGERDTTDARPTKRPHWWWIKAVLLVFLAFALVALVFLIYHAEPIRQARIIETLSARFQSPVQLAEFHVSIDHGFQVSGQGLKIFGKRDSFRALQPRTAFANQYAARQPSLLKNAEY